VIAQVGPEQEYFLIDRGEYLKREDLVMCGRTLFGAKPPKGQELEDHYFGVIRPRVAAFMRELDEELWKLGVFAKTKHNEAAPAQHELAPVFCNANAATDQNQLTMELMKTIAERHNLACLLHEKPFLGVNGSGKHNNWSISTAEGENLLSPGHDPFHNKQFLLFLAAVIKAVDDFQDLLRISIASAGNDHRLGAAEAPPAIVSMFLGDELSGVLDAFERGEEYQPISRIDMTAGVQVLPEFKKDTTDRNRTSPFAFTGNKFEFRMLGSSLSIADPNTILNTIVSEVLSQFADKIEAAVAAGKAFEDALDEVIRNTIRCHKRIIFNGDGYTEDWVREAEARGLLNLKTTPEALPYLVNSKNLALFTKHKIFSETEIRSRYEILMENYVKVVGIEALTMLDMAKKQILPACIAYTKLLAEAEAKKREIGIVMEDSAEMALCRRCSALTAKLHACIGGLEAVLERAKDVTGIREGADYTKDAVIAAMDELRSTADELEGIVGEEYWPYPTYRKLLFDV
ncbi:MAG: glutamine synthetase, partial [Clostridia bacterium]|nr:glutamine synthetase [Clostridia bacterium]